MSPYVEVPFHEAVRDATGGNPKVKRREYLPDGPIPVVDQGRQLTSGYTVSENAYTGQLPVVIFGDHTRIFKYIDFPFALGADGVKVLAPKNGFDTSYLYHYFRHLQIPGRGYSRHFKFLRGFSVCKPPINEQQRIAGILNRAANIERLRKRAQERLLEFIPALFVKMFGDPATNPMGWDVSSLSAISVLGPQYGVNARSTTLLDGHPRYIRITDIREEGTLTSTPVGPVSPDHDRYVLMDGDLLFARSGSVGKCYLYRAEDGPCIFASYLIRFRLNKEIMHPDFMFAFTRSVAYCDWIARIRRTGLQSNINGREYGALPVPVPPIRLQNHFSSIVDALRCIAARNNNASIAVDLATPALMSQLIGDAP